MAGSADLRRESISLAAVFWFFNSGFGVLAPFVALYYASLEFSGWRMGLLTAIPAVAALVSGPFWGNLADSRGAHRLILRASLLATAAGSMLVGSVTSYPAVATAVALFALAAVPTMSLIDCFTVDHAARGGASYGMLRVFGSIGFIVTVLLMGRVMGDNVSNRFYFIYPIPLILTLAATATLKPIGGRVARSLSEGISVVIRIPEFVLLVATAFLLNITMNAYTTYLGLHVDHVGARTEVTSQAMAIGALSELPFIAFGSWILTRLGSRRMIMLAISAFSIRFVVLSFAGGAAPILLTALLQGASYGVFLVASITMASKLAPRAYQATAQSVLATMSYGLGSIIGSFGGGMIVDAFSTVTLFRVLAVIALSTLAIFTIGDQRLQSPHTPT